MPTEPMSAERKWTTHVPQVDGYYWFRAEGYKALVVWVFDWRGGGLAVHMPIRSNHSDGIAPVNDVAGEWCGPLQPPE